MISRSQQILIKRAQQECALDDTEYRDALQTVAHCRSSKDSALTDRHVDILLCYFEAIYWRKVDAGLLPTSSKANAVFRQRDYWKAKNTRQETSRDRYTGVNLRREITNLEVELQGLGFGKEYCAGIRSNVTHGREDAHALHLYRAALDRTLQSKLKAAGTPG